MKIVLLSTFLQSSAVLTNQISCHRTPVRSGRAEDGEPMIGHPMTAEHNVAESEEVVQLSKTHKILLNPYSWHWRSLTPPLALGHVVDAHAHFHQVGEALYM